MLSDGQRRRPRRRARWRRLAPLIAVALGALAVGIVVGANSGRAERTVVSQYVHAWAHGQYSRMYRLLDSESRQRLTEAAFSADYQRDARTATLLKLVALRVGNLHGNVIDVSMVARTSLF